MLDRFPFLVFSCMHYLQVCAVDGAIVIVIRLELPSTPIEQSLFVQAHKHFDRSKQEESDLSYKRLKTKTQRELSQERQAMAVKPWVSPRKEKQNQTRQKRVFAQKPPKVRVRNLEVLKIHSPGELQSANYKPARNIQTCTLAHILQHALARS